MKRLMDWTFVCECAATCSHACLNSGWEANMTGLQTLCVCVCTQKRASVAMRLCVHVYVCMHVCVRVCGPAAATRRLMCWGSSPFDKLSPGFSCSPASLCWKQCVGTGPPASPLSPRSPAKNHTHEHTVNLMISAELHSKIFYNNFFFNIYFEKDQSSLKVNSYIYLSYSELLTTSHSLLQQMLRFHRTVRIQNIYQSNQCWRKKIVGSLKIFTSKTTSKRTTSADEDFVTWQWALK